MKKFSILIMSAVLGCLASGRPALAPLTLAWDPSPDSTVNEYQLYILDETQHALRTFRTSASSITLLLPQHEYHFAVTAINLYGNESEFSNEVTVYGGGDGGLRYSPFANSEL
jgi:hypothetical protein